MTYPPLNRVNAGRVRPRWAPLKRRPRGRRRGALRRGRGRLGGSRRGGSVRPRRRVTLVLTKNNFWASLHEGAHLVWLKSAGQVPGSAGSRRGRPAAAATLAEWCSHRARTRAVRVARVVRPPYFRRRPPRRTRRWQDPARVLPRVPVATLEVSLVNWGRHRTWRAAWRKFFPGVLRGRRLRVAVRVDPVRPHNGMRPPKKRRG